MFEKADALYPMLKKVMALKGKVGTDEEINLGRCKHFIGQAGFFTG